MPNTAAGIETAPPEHDVNSAAGFEAAMAGKGVVKDEGEESVSDTSVASGLEVIKEGQPRTESGTFVPSTPAAEPDPPAAPAVESDYDGEDPVVVAFLEKHSGDRDAAIKAAAHQADLLGRQGQELGQTREQLAELKGRLDQITATQTAAPAAPPATNDQIEEQAAALMESKGYIGAATDAANASLAGDERLLKNVIEAWQLEEPFEAMNFLSHFRAWQANQEAAPAAQPDAWVEGNKATERIGQTLTELASELGKDAWEPIAPFMLDALDTMPEAVGKMVVSDDAAERKAGIELVADRAAKMASKVPPAADAGKSAVTERKLAGSAVATGSLRPSVSSTKSEPGVAPTKEEVAEAVKSFKEEFLATEDTDVRAGLTFGKAYGPPS